MSGRLLRVEGPAGKATVLVRDGTFTWRGRERLVVMQVANGSFDNFIHVLKGFDGLSEVDLYLDEDRFAHNFVWESLEYSHLSRHISFNGGERFRRTAK